MQSKTDSSSFRVTVSDCPHSPEHDYSDRAQCRAQRYQDRKTVRHVVSSDEVAHLWAHKAQAEAHNPKRSVFFRDSVIFSYGEHFPIARHVTSKSGKPAVLFTTGHYSVTTSGHCSMVRGAVSHLTVFKVAHVVGKWGTDNHEENLKDYGDRISASLLKAARARSNRDWHHSQALELRAEAVAYAKFFGLAYSQTLPTVPALGSASLAKIKAVEDKRQAAERKAVAEANREAVATWRQGGSSRLPYGLPDMLRVSGDGQTIETSRGASFPISHAKRGLALVRSVRASGLPWHTNGHTCTLGHYRQTDWTHCGRNCDPSRLET